MVLPSWSVKEVDEENLALTKYLGRIQFYHFKVVLLRTTH